MFPPWLTRRYLTGNDQHPLVIYGAEGSGKTCLSARAAQQSHSWQQLDPACALEMGVLLRFIRLTPESSTALSVLHSLTQQVSLLITGRLPRNPHVRFCATFCTTNLIDHNGLCTIYRRFRITNRHSID